MRFAWITVWNKLLGQRCHESLVAVDDFMSLKTGTLPPGVTATDLGFCATEAVLGVHGVLRAVHSDLRLLTDVAVLLCAWRS